MNKININKPFIIYSENLFVKSSNLLLHQLIGIKHTKAIEDIDQFRQILAEQIELFEKRLNQAKIDAKHILAARYCLCTALDETILGTSWGINSTWHQQTLLNLFHQETWGGERFYIILDTLLETPKAHRHLLELLNILIYLGFKGKCFYERSGASQAISTKIFNKIVYTDTAITTQIESPSEIKKTSYRALIQKINIASFLSINLFVLLCYFITVNIIAFEKNYSTLQLVEKIANTSLQKNYQQLRYNSLIGRSLKENANEH